MVGLGGLEPPTSPLSGARSSHLSYRPQHLGEPLATISLYGSLAHFAIVRNLRFVYKTAISPMHLLCMISKSRFGPSWNVQAKQRQDVAAKLKSAMFWRISKQQKEPQRGALEDGLARRRSHSVGN